MPKINVTTKGFLKWRMQALIPNTTHTIKKYQCAVVTNVTQHGEDPLVPVGNVGVYANFHHPSVSLGESTLPKGPYDGSWLFVVGLNHFPVNVKSEYGDWDNLRINGVKVKIPTAEAFVPMKWADFEPDVESATMTDTDNPDHPIYKTQGKGAHSNLQSAGAGSSLVAPWEERGIVSKGISKTRNWQTIWPDIDITTDPAKEAANFYLLEAIASDVPNRVGTAPLEPIIPLSNQRELNLIEKLDMSKKESAELVKQREAEIIERRLTDPEFDLRCVIGQANVALTILTNRLDKVFVSYFHAACAGEIRHHRAIGGRILNGPNDRDAAWCGWKKVFEEVGVDAIKDISKLFLEFGGVSFGGKRWATAADTLYERETGTLGPTEQLNKRVFIDRAWTLEHNGGCFLNKVSWHSENRKGWGLNELKNKVLNAHASDPPGWKTLLSVADTEVIDLWNRYWSAANTLRWYLDKEEIPNPITNIQYRALCSGCNSDPYKGHFVNCRVVKNHKKYMFTGEPKPGEKHPWMTVVEEEDFHNYGWMKWEIENPPIGPDGKLELPADLKVMVGGYVSIESTERGYEEFQMTQALGGKYHTLGEVLDKEIVFKKLGKGSFGKIKSIYYNITIFEAATMQPIFQAADGKASYECSQDTMSEFKSEPITVKALFHKSNPDTLIVEKVPA